MFNPRVNKTQLVVMYLRLPWLRIQVANQHHQPSKQTNCSSPVVLRVVSAVSLVTLFSPLLPPAFLSRFLSQTAFMSNLLHTPPSLLLKQLIWRDQQSKRERERPSMSKLLSTTQFTSIHRRFFSALRLPEPIPLAPSLSPLSHRFSLYTLSHPHPLLGLYPRGNLSVRGFNSSAEKEPRSSETKTDKDYPSGEHEFKEFGAWKKFGVKLGTLIAFPWERIPNGSVLTMKLRGQVCFLTFFLIVDCRHRYIFLECEEIFHYNGYFVKLSRTYTYMEPLKWHKK